MFSIIIPCYNMEQWVGEAIESVKKQTLDDWECIIVDDGSTDGSRDKILEHIDGDNRFKLIVQENSGVAAARNRAISEAKGNYILPLDADDMLRRNALFEFACAWQMSPDAKIIIPGNYKYGEGVSRVILYEWRGYESFRDGYSSIPNSSCYRKSDWERVGGYRDGTMIEDYEFYLRMLDENSQVVNLHQILIDYRVRKDSRWQNAYKRLTEERDIIKQMNPDIYKETEDEIR